MNYLVFFFISLLISLGLVPLIRKISHTIGSDQIPRENRWGHARVSRLGGIAIYLAFLGGLFVTERFTSGGLEIKWQLLLCSSLMFLIGLFDDFYPLSPPAKFIAQILISAIAIIFGYSTFFFSPRIDNEILAQLPNILLTFLWLVGITNAFNLLDNMDGLAAGIALITASILSYFFWTSGDIALMVISLSLAGAVAGFLIFNFPPASIFMGDSGSLFLGFTLAVLGIARQPQASNVFAVMGVPTLLFLIPILDTALVTFTRFLSGRSPVRGGRDHASHRLIAFGLTERQTVLALYAIALFSGIAAALLEAVQYWFSLVIVPIVIISLAVIFSYLGGMRVLTPEEDKPSNSRFTRILIDLTFRRRLLEVSFDFILIGLSYYLAYLVANGLNMSESLLSKFLDSLPVILISAYLAFFALGVYRRVWRYFDMRDLMLVFTAAIGSGIFAAVIFLSLNAVNLIPWRLTIVPAPLILALWILFLFLGLAASRSSFRLLSEYQTRNYQQGGDPVLIYGAGERGILLVDWLRTSAEWNYSPVGFLDDDPFMKGRFIHGLKVYGGLVELDAILNQTKITGVILAEDYKPGDLEALRLLCDKHGCWIRKLSLMFEQLPTDQPHPGKL